VTDLLRPADLATFVARHAPDAQLIGDLAETPTVPAAAAALGVESDQIIKTLLFVVEQPSSNGEGAQLIVVISNGERRVDKARLAAHLGVGKKRVQLAPAAVVATQLGYAVGGVPPFGHRTQLPTLLDASVAEAAERYGTALYAGGGDDRTMLRLSYGDLLRLTAPTLLALSAPPG
jgi:prolyl-tRNA editing enzyme YbaK/EbsC (Cys-tRNA(Pro) deacylase)